MFEDLFLHHPHVVKLRQLLVAFNYEAVFNL